jgi:phosphomannomutase
MEVEHYMQFIFDVDGTLTPSRGKIDSAFKEFMESFCNKYDCYLVTGSDNLKTREQIGDLFNKMKRVYNCNGNEVWTENTCLWAEDWYPSSELFDTLFYSLRNSKWEILTGKHIEFRPGMINFSVVGRNAGKHHRERYYEWDKVTGERDKIADQINSLHPNVTARVGGETGIDIGPKGKDKSQILKDFDAKNVMFFGDRMDENGNDYPLARAILDAGGEAISVKDWKDTWEFLSSK